MNLQSSYQHFIFGVGIGLFVTMLGWSYSVYYHVSISLIQEIIGSLLLAIGCGFVAIFGDLDKLIDNFPFL
jgi:CDP-diglyceride synthetase